MLDFPLVNKFTQEISSVQFSQLLLQIRASHSYSVCWCLHCTCGRKLMPDFQAPSWFHSPGYKVVK